MRVKVVLSLHILMAMLLTGCMYPEQNLAKNQIPYKDQLQSVQNAVDEFRKENGGILPIQTKVSDTPEYQTYSLDFKKLIPKYMAEPPGTAFENGGVFEYVIVNAETRPTVKLFDLRIAETIQELKLRMKANRYPPFKQRLAYNVYSLDFKKLGYDKPPYAVSPFSHKHLPFVITGDAQVCVDYRPDLYVALKRDKHVYKSGEDIRSLLVDHSMFAPAYSLPYTIAPKTNEPIFLEKIPS